MVSGAFCEWLRCFSGFFPVEVVSKWFQSGSKMVPKWFQSGSKVVPKWFQIGFSNFLGVDVVQNASGMCFMRFFPAEGGSGLV